jgi:cell division protein FtsI/penicillin-binding protein 2
MRRKIRKIKKSAANNRLNFLLAIIFLLGLSLCYRLVFLQVWQYDYYTALASSQHQVYSELQAERGQILVQENTDKGQTYFPMAMNKDLALVYVVPYEIEDAEAVAEVFYALFDEVNAIEALNNVLDQDDFFNISSLDSLTPEEKEERLEFRKIKFELELKIKKEEIVKNYLSKLQKKFDPYEPIKHKVEEDVLAKLVGLELPGVYFVMEKHRYYPDKEVGAHLVGFVGYSGDELSGRYGLEGFFNIELSGERGMIKAEKSAGGGELIINDREYSQAINGSDLYLSIDRPIQYFACQKLLKGVEDYGAESGSVLIMEPKPVQL